MAAFGNKYALGNTGGRPAHYDTPDELMAAVIDFFDYCNSNTVKATITGLALYLGFESRQSFYDYGDKQEFSYVIKRARLAVENSYELSGQTIDIFALKNMGWKDKTSTELSGPDGEGVVLNFRNVASSTFELKNHTNGGIQTKSGIL